jgi:hypothetical protein
MSLDAGDRVTIVDTDLGINSLIRVSGIEFPLVNPYRIKAVIADFVPYTLNERIAKQARDNKQKILTVNKTAKEIARLNALRLHQEQAKKTIPMFQGVYSDGATYYGNPARIDIVRYNPGSGIKTYYTKINAPSESFSDISPTNTDYWEIFEAEYSSIATQLLFAELAYIDNLGVKYFNGIPVPVGDLDGSVVNTQANAAAISEIDTITLTGSDGTAILSCNGAGGTATFDASLENTAYLFATDGTNIASFAAVNVTLGYSGINISFTGPAGTAFSPGASITNTSGTLDGAKADTQSAAAAVARIDTVTLDTGTNGTANVLCDGTTKVATFINNYTETAAAFVALWAASYLAGGVVVTSSGADIIFTAQVAGTDFTGSTEITNVANENRGSVAITGNSIWSDSENSDYGTLMINMKGYSGGLSRYRRLLIGDGKGGTLADLRGNIFGGLVALKASTFLFTDIPTSGAGLDAGQIYRDGSGADAALKIK